MNISNTTIKLAKQHFKNKIVEEAKWLIENVSLPVIYGELIDDSDKKTAENFGIDYMDVNDFVNALLWTKIWIW